MTFKPRPLSPLVLSEVEGLAESRRAWGRWFDCAQHERENIVAELSL